MQEDQSGQIDLNQIRLCEGAEGCRALFGQLCKTDRRRAVSSLNDKRLTFPCLYVLSAQIRENQLARYLNRRNRIGLRLIEEAGGPGDISRDFLAYPNASEYEALRWIWETGREEDGGHDGVYEEMLDITASVLLHTYRDAGILPEVSDMIFARNREGRNIHGLVWAFFRTCHPDTLRLLAKRIRSSDQRDAALACTLLGLDSLECGGNAGYQNKYESYLQWLHENDPYLYFTDEGMQYASNPAFYRVDLERKYLQRGTPSYRRQPLIPANAGERERLRAFRALSEEEKAMVAEHSHRVRAMDPKAWKEWMGRSPVEQAGIARAERGVKS